jgi:uncharacterized RDD family membrane protein YckC
MTAMNQADNPYASSPMPLSEPPPSPLVGVASKARFFAMVIDNLAAAATAMVAASSLPEAFGSGLVGVAVFVYLAYYFVQETLWATTLGKLLLGLTIVKLDGTPHTGRGAAWRTIARLIEVNPIFLGALPGGLAVAFSKHHQRFGDMLAGSIVIERSRVDEVRRAAQQQTAADEEQ